MMHIPAHKNVQSPPAQIVNDPIASRRRELFGRKADMASNIVNKRLQEREVAREMVKRAMARQ